MTDKKNWDWEPGTREIIHLSRCNIEFDWQEEIQISPNGEKAAAVVNLGNCEFSVCENMQLWDEPFEKVWGLKYTPWGNTIALVMQDGKWSVAEDGKTWDEFFDFVWDMRFSEKNNTIAVAVQKDLQYGMAIDATPWKSYFLNANQFAVSPDGKLTAAVVQTERMEQADIQAYKKGCYSLAVNGQTWPEKFVNLWTPVFDHQSARVAAQCRTSIYDYTIAVDGKTWDNTFSGVWRPAFNPVNQVVSAPVRMEGKWGLAQDGTLIQKPSYFQMWNLAYDPTGKNWGAIVASEFGKWTIAVNDKTWKVKFPTAVADLTFSPHGSRIAALGKIKDKWRIIVDGKVWDGDFDMAWQPVFSENELHLAAKVEKNGFFSIILDNRQIDIEYDALWPPTFSPDSKNILVRGIKDDRVLRSVIPVDN